jgi:hypothetical protein
MVRVARNAAKRGGAVYNLALEHALVVAQRGSVDLIAQD